MFKTIIAALFAATSVVAAPLEARQSGSGDYFTPSATWLYNVRTGAIAATDYGYVSKASNNLGNDVTTLVTFTYPKAAEGKKCQFGFYLDNSATVRGSKKLDLFSSSSPAPGPRDSWGPGNQRNNNLGRFNPVVGGFATTWDAKYSAFLTEKTDCRLAGTQEGFELVGVWDEDLVSWDTKTSGPRIIYS